jgi:hypothetical protein
MTEEEVNSQVGRFYAIKCLPQMFTYFEIRTLMIAGYDTTSRA